MIEESSAQSAPRALPQSLVRFLDLFGNLTEESVDAHVQQVYHEDIWFNDTLKTIEGRSQLEPYLRETAGNVVSCQVIPEAWSETEDGLYFRWKMEIEFKKVAKRQLCPSIGMTHFRLADDGRINFHQDYWDSTEGFFVHVPVVGQVIRWIRGRV